MRRTCAWCKKNLEDSNSGDEAEVTHGICEHCRVSLLSSYAPRDIHKFLSFFSLPVMMLDSDCRVVSANQAALELTDKKPAEINNVLAGNVMSCKHAHLEGGCGQTVHCAACTISDCVIKTYLTEESLHKIPAKLSADKNLQETNIAFLISTEKLGDIVLLRIDKVN